MALLIFLVYALIAALVSAGQGVHPYPEFIENEILKTTMLDWDSMIKEINEQKLTIEKLIDRYNTYVTRRSVYGDNVEDIWNEHFAIAYQKFSDRWLILTHVCELMYAEDRECKFEDTWDDDYDGRGAIWREKYILEIHMLYEKHRESIDNYRARSRDL